MCCQIKGNNMRMEKRKFRIGELAEHLAVERFVIRFWEKEFDLAPTRSTGKQRFYDGDDLKTFALIKELLYNRGFTIAGARKELPHLKRGASLATIQPSVTVQPAIAPSSETHTTIVTPAQLLPLKKKLAQLRTLIETLG
jgi:DNA-binding transcriptional MerR regulator